MLLSPAHVTYVPTEVFSGVASCLLRCGTSAETGRKGQTVHWGVFAGGIVVLFASVVLLHFRIGCYALNKTFEAVQWRDSRCYAIGERTGDLLLFCVELSPRNRS